MSTGCTCDSPFSHGCYQHGNGIFSKDNGHAVNTRPHSVALYKVNSQQWLSIESIEAVDDYGFDVGVTLRSGRKLTVSGGDRDRFFAAVGIAQITG